MKCSLCGKDSDKIRLTISGRNIYVCADCDYEFLFPQLSKEENERLYNETYYKPWGLDKQQNDEATAQMKKETFSIYIDIIKTRKNSGKLLDVGCATGYLMEVAGSRGFEAYGIDISAYSSGVARGKFAEGRVFTGTLDRSLFNGLLFDVITMTDVLEHAPDPVETLKQAKTLLAKDGIVFLVTPNVRSVSNRLLGAKWSNYKLEHLHYFSKSSIRKAAAMAGLKVIACRRSSKYLNLKYTYNQFVTFPHWLLTPLFTILYKLLPDAALRANIPVPIGEMIVVLKNND
jgi:2-polyprenyl-3-methyl-5-hydroxy-6-metoxy-1,4-benzoquinol methylase